MTPVELEREGVDVNSDGVEIHTGWTVVSNSGDRIGQVEDVYPDHIIVAKGFLFPSRWRVPASAISHVEHDWVQLRVTRQQVELQSWDNPVGVEESGNTVDDLARNRDTFPPHPQRQRQDVVTDYRIDTPLSPGEIRIHRQPLAAEGQEIGLTGGFADIEISIPVFGEQAVVRTTPVVREVAVITRSLRERTERVTDTVRREEVVIERNAPSPHGDVTRPVAI